MLISFSRKFIFIANLKTASTAIEGVLRPVAEICLVESRLGKHMPLQAIEQRFGWLLDRFGRENFLIFGVIRDPVDYLVSLYNSHAANKFKDDLNLYTGDMDFDKFISEWTERNADQIRPQFERFLTTNGTIGANYIISYANLTEGLRWAGSIINVPGLPKLGQQNVSDRRLQARDLSEAQRKSISQRFTRDKNFMVQYCDRVLDPGIVPFDSGSLSEQKASTTRNPQSFRAGKTRSASHMLTDDSCSSETPTLAPADVVDLLYRAVLRRDADVEGREFAVSLIKSGRSVLDFVRVLMNSREFRDRNLHPVNKPGQTDPLGSGCGTVVPDIEYRCPTDLTITPVQLRRVAVIGACLMTDWPKLIKEMQPDCQCDFMLFNNTQELPKQLPAPIADYDFQLISIPLRPVLPDSSYFRLSYARPEVYETLFLEACQRLRQFLVAAMRWNKEHGILTFVVNFLLPQQNPMGRLLPRHDLRNLVYFVDRLNEVLSEELQKYNNTFLFDFDQIVATFGRKFFQDDIVCITNHNAWLSEFDWKWDQQRLDKPVKLGNVYRNNVSLYLRLAWTELLAMYRTIRQIDMVKLVILDVDDTLWRGVGVERADHDEKVIEGWPIGLAEALGHLKRRGVLLALLSKNEEQLLTPVWERVFGRRLALDDFAIRKINWRPKVENFEEILNEANLLPRNVVYIDDNPVERASIKAAFPDARVLGPTPLVWRRVLLWSSETQVPTITAESAARTEMVRAQVERELQRRQLSREEFLATLSLEVGLREFRDVEHPDFPRALELINKSNQFNTSGRRWSRQEFLTALGKRVRLFVFDVEDKFTHYGVVGVIICAGPRIEQFVMSCRVVGLEVEIAAVAALLRIIRADTSEAVATAELIETELNLLARDLWERCGFECKGGQWSRRYLPALATPPHVKVIVEDNWEADFVAAE
jgi:FkbH-like protein